MPKQASNSSSGSGILIFQKSLKALVNISKNSKHEIDKKDVTVSNEKDEGDDSSSKSVTDSITNMSQKCVSSSKKRGGPKRRRGKFEAETDKQSGTRLPQTKEVSGRQSETRETGTRQLGGGEPVTRESITRKLGHSELPGIRESGTKQHRTGDSRGRHHGTRDPGMRQHGIVRPGTGRNSFQSRSKEISTNDFSKQEKSVADLKMTNFNKGHSAHTNKSQSLEEDWTNDLLNVDKSVEIEDGKSTVGTCSKISDHLEQSKIDQDKKKVSELNKSFKEAELDSVCGKNSCEVVRASKSEAGGPLQSTPKKKQERKTFEKCALDLSDTDIIEDKGNSNRQEMQAKLDSVTPQHTKEDTTKASDTLKNDRLRGRQNRAWDRNRNDGDRNSVSNIVKNSYTGSRRVMHSARSFHENIHDRRDFRGGRRQLFEPKPELPPRLRRTIGGYREYLQNSNNIARSVPSSDTHEPHSRKLVMSEHLGMKGHFRHIPSGDIEIASRCSSDVVSHGWEVPCSEDWTSEVDEKDHLMNLDECLVSNEDSEVQILSNNDLNSSLSSANQMNPAYDVDNVDACIRDVQEKLRGVCVSDKPYLPPPPPLDEASSNTTTESMYNTAKDSLENTASPGSKENSMFETSSHGQGEKNMHRNTDRCVDESPKKDMACMCELYSSPQNDDFVGTCENDEDRYMSSSHGRESEKVLYKSIDGQGSNVVASMYEEQTKLDETDSYPVMDCSESDIYQNGMASQENVDIDFASFQEFDNKTLGFLEPELNNNSPDIKNGNRLIPSEIEGRTTEDQRPLREDYMLYREWYQKKYLEWYSHYNSGQYDSSWDWSGPVPYGGMAAEENPDYPMPSHPVGPEGQLPWYPQGRVSDFWRDRMPYWVNSQKETAKSQIILLQNREDTEQDLAENQTSNTDTGAIQERRFNTYDDDIEKNSHAHVNSKSSTCKDNTKNVVNHAVDVDAQARADHAERTNLTESTKQHKRTSQPVEVHQTERTSQADKARMYRRASTDDENMQQESPKAGQCVCSEDQVRYLVWRMCGCPAGTPPRLHQVYHRGRGQEDWSLDLGYQSYDSIDDQCLTHRSARQLFYGPPSSSSPAFPPEGRKLRDKAFTAGPSPRLPLKPSLSQRVLQGLAPGPPPGFQPLVYTLTADNRPAGRGGPISSQQAGTEGQVDNRHGFTTREPLDNDNKQPLSQPQPQNLEVQNNNTPRDSLVTTVPTNVQGNSDFNNNNQFPKQPSSSSVAAVGESRSSTKQQYLPNGVKIPESLSNSAAHLAQASASLHKAGLSDMKLNSVLHTFSEAIVAIGKTIQGDEEESVKHTPTGQQPVNLGVIGDGRHGELHHSNDDGQCDGNIYRKHPGARAYGRSCSMDPRYYPSFPRDKFERADSSPGCFDARNVSERSSICDADNESDGGGEEVIMEHPMMKPTKPANDRVAENPRTNQHSGSGILNHPMMSQVPEAGILAHPMMGQRPELSWYQDIDDMFNRVTQQQYANMNKAAHTRSDQAQQQHPQQGRMPGLHMRPPASFIGPYLPPDFRPRSHFLNGRAQPRFSPSPDGRISPTQDASFSPRSTRFSPSPDKRPSPSPDQRMYKPQSYGGERMPGSRWGPIWERPNDVPPSNQGNQLSPATSQDNTTPPGWRVNPLPAGIDRRSSAVGCNSEQASSTQQTPVKIDKNMNSDSRCCASASFSDVITQDRHTMKQACKLVDYGYEDSDDDELLEYAGEGMTYENDKNKGSVTTPEKQYTPKKFCADLSQNFSPILSDEEIANIPLPASAPPAVGPRTNRQPLKQKVLKSMTTSTKPHAPKLLFPEQKPQSDPHGGKKRTFAEILAASKANKHSYSSSSINAESGTTQTSTEPSKKVSPLLALPEQQQQQELPPLPPLPPFPSSPFWGMYMPASNLALTGREKEEKTYSEAARAGVGQQWGCSDNQQQVASKQYSRRSWPISSAGRFNYTPSSESDNDSRSGTLQDWRLSFKQFHNFGVKYIDTHCHLDFLFTREGYQGSFRDYMTKHAETFPDMFEGCVAVFCNPNSFRPNDGLWLEVAKEPNVWLAMGCHPKSATDFTDFAEAGLRKCLKHSKCIALGEIGLDYSGTFYKHEAVQKQVFRRQLAIALEMNKPLVIHCRAAEDDCLAILKEMVPRDYKIHCHCFTAYFSNAQLWLDAFPNLYIGLTPLVTYRTASPAHDTAAKIPLNRLLLETDAPYFIPRCIPKTDMQFSNPGLAITVAKEVAQRQDLPVAAVLRQCRLNTKFMYGI